MLSVLFSVPCAASENIITVNDLIEQSVSLDNTEVTIQGEVIGEAIERGEYAWININDTTNAIGVWIKKSDTDNIRRYGDYKRKGDIIIITGVFHRACPEHGGDVDIHCANIEIVETGYNIKEHISAYKIAAALISILTSAVTVGVYIKLRKKQTRSI